MSEHTRNLWVLVSPAPDVPGQWVGHCLNLDIVTVGTSVTHALQMTAEAVMMCVSDDLEHGRDPFARDGAPDEEWQVLRRVTSCGTYGALPSTAKVIAATQFKLVINDKSRVERMPPAWMIENSRLASEMRV